ncbi:MAG: endonuclease/exonuclease/phosphatase family protein [Chitinophagaceae bacterium]|nr:endonuclease/exonuclease/phosphatase family protein [Chitinophagaceae bacterium]
MFKGFLALFPAVTGFLLFVSALGWYYRPVSYLPLALLTLVTVYALPVACYIFIRQAFARHKWKATVWAVLLLLALPPFLASVTLPVKGSKFLADRPTGTLRVMQWNCGTLVGNLISSSEKKPERLEAVRFIQQLQPDVICLQDYADVRGRYTRSNHALLQDTLGYRFTVNDWHFQQVFNYGVVRHGTAIYAKIPLLATGVLPFTNRQYPEAIVWADVLLNKKRVRIVTVHFRSMNLNGHNTYKSIPFNQFVHQDSAIIMSKNILNKMVYYQQEHSYQAQVLRRFIDTCRYPVVLAADLNTVPAQHTYRLAKGTLRDDFFGHTTGLAATFNYLAPNIRIDYLMSSRALRCLQWYHHREGFFDHDPLLADYDFPAQ